MDYIITDVIPEENIIIQSVIDNLPKPRFVMVKDELVIDYIFVYCIKLLTFAKDKHESKEVAYAINLNTLDFVGAELGDAKTVDISPLIDKMKGAACIFIVLHNHPSNGPFSYRDLNTFFDTPNMAILMVIGNKGSMYIIEKIDKIKIDDDYLLIKRILISFRKNEKSFDETIQSLIKHGVAYSSI